MSREQLESRIRDLAHRFWEEEGRPEGREVEHWCRAEERLAKERGGGSVEGQATHRREDQEDDVPGSRRGPLPPGRGGSDPDGAQSGMTKEQVFLEQIFVEKATQRMPR